jgi:hypothetical protein
MTSYPSISDPSMNNTVVAFSCLVAAMGQIRMASQLAPHLFPGPELDTAIDLLDTELLELQRRPDWK